MLSEGPAVLLAGVLLSLGSFVAAAVALEALGVAVLRHRRNGTLPGRAKIQLYFGGAAPFGLPPTPASLEAYASMLDGTGLVSMVGVIGGDVLENSFATAAIDRGFHLRVGLEDFHGGRTPRNEDLVVEAAALVRSLGCEVATSEQARTLLSA
jgi:uncharacterized protein (DUF849 family)